MYGSNIFLYSTCLTNLFKYNQFFVVNLHKLKTMKHFLLVKIVNAVQVMTEGAYVVYKFPPQPSPSRPREFGSFWDVRFGHIKTLPIPPNSDLLVENVNNFWDFGFGHIKYHLFSQNRTFSFCGDFTVSKIKWIMFLIFSSIWMKETKGFVTLVGLKLLTSLSMPHSWILGFLGQKIENLK